MSKLEQDGHFSERDSLKPIVSLGAEDAQNQTSVSASQEVLAKKSEASTDPMGLAHRRQQTQPKNLVFVESSFGQTITPNLPRLDVGVHRVEVQSNTSYNRGSKPKLPFSVDNNLGSLDDDSDYHRRFCSPPTARSSDTSSSWQPPSARLLSSAQRSLEIATSLKLLRSVIHLLSAMNNSSLEHAKQEVKAALHYIRSNNASKDTVLEARCCFYMGIVEYALTLYTTHPGRILTPRPTKWFERALEAEKRYPEGKIARQWINYYDSTTLSPHQVLPDIQVQQSTTVIDAEQVKLLDKSHGSAEPKSPQSSDVQRGERISSFTSMSYSSEASGTSYDRSHSENGDALKSLAVEAGKEPELARTDFPHPNNNGDPGPVPALSQGSRTSETSTTSTSVDSASPSDHVPVGNDVHPVDPDSVLIQNHLADSTPSRYDSSTGMNVPLSASAEPQSEDQFKPDIVDTLSTFSD